MRFFINADDFGWTDLLNAAIHESLCRGWIQQTSLMMNCGALEEAVRLTEQSGYRDRVCFHLNLMDGAPLTENIKSTALCYPKAGTFRNANAKRILRRCMSPRAIRAIRKECEAQMRAFRDRGFTSTRIDSHRWCLFHLPVWIAIRPLLKRYGFQTTRTPKGHLFETNKGVMRLYFRFVAALVGTALRYPETWSGCGGEMAEQKPGEGGHGDPLVELYVHPKMIDGVSTDTFFTYEKEQKPVEEVAAFAAGHGRLDDPYRAEG